MPTVTPDEVKKALREAGLYLNTEATISTSPKDIPPPGSDAGIWGSVQDIYSLSKARQQTAPLAFCVTVAGTKDVKSAIFNFPPNEINFVD
jgi:hypothetical protein